METLLLLTPTEVPACEALAEPLISPVVDYGELTLVADRGGRADFNRRVSFLLTSQG